MTSTKRSRGWVLEATSVALAVLCLGVAACTAGNDDPEPAAGCAVGDVAACDCGNNVFSTQACLADGTFGVCECGAAGAGGSAGTAGSSGMAGVGGTDVAGSSGSGGTGESGTGGSAGEAGTGGSTAGTGGGSASDPVIPMPTEACPTFAEGIITIKGRTIQLYMGTDGDTKLGPVIIYWHGTGGEPTNAAFHLGSTVITEVKSQGGFIAAMHHTGGSGSPTAQPTDPVWFYEDYDVIDELLACAISTGVGIDTKRIHATGFSAGGLQSSAMVYGRSNYLASVVVFSGGIIANYTRTTPQNPNNKLAVMLIHGGPTDGSGQVPFQDWTEAQKADLLAKGNFAFICDHNGGHVVPMELQAPLWAFFQAHTFGTNPSPYAGGLPNTFPSYCAL